MKNRDDLKDLKAEGDFQDNILCHSADIGCNCYHCLQDPKVESQLHPLQASKPEDSESF